VADAFDSLTHRRTYKAAVPLHVTMERPLRDAGTALDPDAADALEYLYRTGRLDVFVEATD
jgi:HD-GYP domain-containing protein (c-di-GMP phosphodiesterase class II)